MDKVFYIFLIVIVLYAIVSGVIAERKKQKKQAASSEGDEGELNLPDDFAITVDVLNDSPYVLSISYDAICQHLTEEQVAILRKRIECYFEPELLKEVVEVDVSDLESWEKKQMTDHHFLTDRVRGILHQRLRGTFDMGAHKLALEEERNLEQIREEKRIATYYDNYILDGMGVIIALKTMGESIVFDDMVEFISESCTSNRSVGEDETEDKETQAAKEWVASRPQGYQIGMIEKLIKADTCVYIPTIAEWVPRELHLYGIKTLAEISENECLMSVISEDDRMMNRFAMDIDRRIIRYESERKSFLRDATEDREAGDNKILSKRMNAYMRQKSIRLIK